MVSQENLALNTGEILKLAKLSNYNSFLIPLHINQSAFSTTCVEPGNTQPNSLVFISTPDHLELTDPRNASIIVAHESLSQIIVQNLNEKTQLQAISIFLTKSIPASMSILLSYFDKKMLRFPDLIHPSSAISSTAKIGRNVRIGPFSSIGDGAEIGDHAVIGPNCNIEAGAKLGDRSILHSHVFLGAHCIVGHDSEIHPFTCIGSDGFGYVQDPMKKRHKIPQLGIVRIGHFVEIGASCTIDRATLSETIIGDGTKIDNLSHFAHNVKIGKNCAITAGFNIAGSSKIGDNFMCGGQTGVADHTNITDNVTIGARGGVTKDVTEPGAYAGFPLEPMRNAVRTLASLPHLADLRKAVSQIQKKLGIE